jgi:hypothetical protein
MNYMNLIEGHMLEQTLAKVSELPVTNTVPLALYAQQIIWWLCGPLLEEGPLLNGPMLFPAVNFTAPW